MSRHTVCYCQQEIMSQCAAPSQAESVACHFYEKAQHAERCMYFVFDKFCDSYKAQSFGYAPPDNDRDDDYDQLLDLDDFIETEEVAQKSCHNCILYACSHVVHENNQAQGRGGLTYNDLINIACNCEDYDDEATMRAKTNLSLRGIQP